MVIELVCIENFGDSFFNPNALSQSDFGNVETYKDDETERRCEIMRKDNLSFRSVAQSLSLIVFFKTNSDAVERGVSRQFVNQIVVG